MLDRSRLPEDFLVILPEHEPYLRGETDRLEITPIPRLKIASLIAFIVVVSVFILKYLLTEGTPRIEFFILVCFALVVVSIIGLKRNLALNRLVENLTRSTLLQGYIVIREGRYPKLRRRWGVPSEYYPSIRFAFESPRTRQRIEREVWSQEFSLWEPIEDQSRFDLPVIIVYFDDKTFTIL